MSSRKQISIQIVSMFSEHMDAVEEIERDCFEYPWTRRELEKARKKRYYLPKVAMVTLEGTRKKFVAGFTYVEQDKFRYTLLSLAIHTDWRRYGIGTALVEYFIKRLRRNRHYGIYELVRETNLNAQKFYRDGCGFVALRPKRQAYDDTEEDAYPMVFKWEWSPQGRAANGEPKNCGRRNHFCTACGECD